MSTGGPSRRELLAGSAGLAAAGLAACSAGSSKKDQPTKPAEAGRAPGANAPGKNWTVLENEKPGTEDHTFEFVPAKFKKVAGYLTADTAKAGDKLTVRAESKAPYKVDVFRYGYYGGKKARKVWSGGPFKPQTQPAPPP